MKEVHLKVQQSPLVGSLNFLTTTHPNITFVVGILSRFMNQPCEGHWIATNGVLKYLKGT